jgi:hypothetical protein
VLGSVDGPFCGLLRLLRLGLSLGSVDGPFCAFCAWVCGWPLLRLLRLLRPSALLRFCASALLRSHDRIRGCSALEIDRAIHHERSKQGLSALSVSLLPKGQVHKIGLGKIGILV